MHKSSFELMSRILEDHYFPGMTVLDCGSRVAPGSSTTDIPGYHDVARKLNLVYTGLDSQSGHNVDKVGDVYDIPFPGGSFDLVISGQLIEHLTFPLFAVQEMKRVCSVEGHVILIAPRRWREHKHPLDCWRLLEDGMRFLLEGFEVLDAGVVEDDCYGVGRKPMNYSPPWEITRLK